jgi:hypothetical protein
MSIMITCVSGKYNYMFEFSIFNDALIKVFF